MKLPDRHSLRRCSSGLETTWTGVASVPLRVRVILDRPESVGPPILISVVG
jgi:hypothetical protein